MFRLGNQVDGDARRHRGIVREHQQLGRPRNRIDTHLPHHLALRLGDPAASGPHDLVHPRHGGRAIGERGHGLGTTNPEQAGDAGKLTRGENRIGEEPAGRGDGDDVANPGHYGGNGIHDDGRGVRGLPTGNVEADAVQGT